MKVKLTKPARVNALAGTFEVEEGEANRLFLLNVAVEVKDPVKPARKTKKKEAE